MAQHAGASAAKAGTALLRQKGVNALRSSGVSAAVSQGNRSYLPLSPFASGFPWNFSRPNRFVLNRGSSAGYSSAAIGSSMATSAGAPRMLVENPRPTEYQTEICNEAVNVKPGVETSSTKGLIFLTALLIVVPIVHTKYELHKYYSEYGHFYKTGWDLYHYDKGKNTYLS